MNINKDINKGELFNVPICMINSIDIEKNGLLVQDIVIKKSKNLVKVHFLDANDKLIKFPIKFNHVSIYGALQKSPPRYLGIFSYGSWHFGGCIQYQIIKKSDEKEKLDIYLSIGGRPSNCGDLLI